METAHYLSEFEKAAGGLDATLLAQKGLDVEVGVWLRSVVLRMHKKTWANKPFERPQSDSAIFFSIWLNEKDVKPAHVYYNIHALKLRQLRGYRITSRDFAADFRAGFKPFAPLWPNVSVDFGPLNLMEGWAVLDAAAAADPVASAPADSSALAIAGTVARLAKGFMDLEPLVDALLERRKK
jgi:hypothetical protein